MRVCLFWNESAGGGNSLGDLTAQLKRAGHIVDRVIDRGQRLQDHLADIDCVVAAGGDGTIARAARALAGGDIPLAILPRGTANNIATSLAIEGDADALMARWSLEGVVPIDIGVVDVEGQSRYFVESVGVGLVADCIDRARATISKDDPESHLEEARQLYVDAIAEQPSRRFEIVMAAETMANDYLLLEALNTPLIGPGLRFTGDANAADGLLSVVAVSSADRPLLARYLQALRDGSTRDAGINAWRIPELEVRGADRLHVDDEVIEVDGPVRISIAAGALRVLG
jgi:diacylglycerol kinase family enzyme